MGEQSEEIDNAKFQYSTENVVTATTATPVFTDIETTTTPVFTDIETNGEIVSNKDVGSNLNDVAAATDDDDEIHSRDEEYLAAAATDNDEDSRDEEYLAAAPTDNDEDSFFVPTTTAPVFCMELYINYYLLCWLP